MAPSADRPQSVVLVDSHLILQEGLTAILAPTGYDVVAAVHTWPDAVTALHEHQPHLCLMELALPASPGPVDITLLMTHSPQTQFVVLTANDSVSQLNAALSSGAVGYVHKTRGFEVLLDVMARVCAGEVVIEGSFMRDKTVQVPPSPELAHLARYLTRRERECLTLLAKGHATEAIAETLGITPTTVRTHVQGVLVKLGVHSRLEAAALATHYGLVEWDAESS